MSPCKYRFRFLFIHPDIDFTEARRTLSAIPRIQTSYVSTAGQGRISHRGEKLEGKYFDSRWGFDFETSDAWRKSEDESIADAIEGMLQKLSPHKSLLDELANKGCDLQLIVSIDVEGNTAHGFAPALLQKLSDLHLTLWFDLYLANPVT